MYKIFGLFFACALAACHFKPQETLAPVFGQVMGDSVAFGTGATNPDHNLTACLTEVTGQTFLNQAVPGSTSRDWAGQKTDLIVAQHPKLVFVSLGGNDLQQHMEGKLRTKNPFYDSFPLSETLSNLKNIFTDLSQSDVIFLGINPPKMLARPQTFLLDNRLDRIQTEVAPAAGVLVIANAYDGMWLNPKLMSDDIHPNDAGYALLCDRIRAAMSSSERFRKYLR